MIETVRDFLNELQKLPEEQLDIPIYMWNYAGAPIPIDNIGIVYADKYDVEYAVNLKEGDAYIAISRST